MKSRRDTISEVVERDLRNCSLNENIFGLGASPRRMQAVAAQRAAVAARLGAGIPGYGTVPSPAYDPVAQRRQFIPSSLKLGFMLARDPIASINPNRLSPHSGGVSIRDVLRTAMETNPNVRQDEINRLRRISSPVLNPNIPFLTRKALARRAATLSAFRVPATTPTVTSGGLTVTPTGVAPPVIFDRPNPAQVIAGAAARKYVYDPLTRNLPGLVARFSTPREYLKTGRRFRGAIPHLGYAVKDWGSVAAAQGVIGGISLFLGSGNKSVGLHGLGPGDPASDGGDRYSGAQLYRGG